MPSIRFWPSLQVLAGAGGGVAVGGDRPLLQRRGTAADGALDAVLDHEIQAARRWR